MKDFDIIIIGGGLVGCACAVALAQQGHEVALLDSRATADIVPSAAQEDWDSRIYVISPGNAAWLETLDVWNMLDRSRICPIENMHVWGDASTEPLQLNAYESNVAQLGFVVENRALQSALWSRMQEAGVKVFTEVECAALHIDEKHASIELAKGGALTAKLVIAADGANSWVRRQAGIAVQAHDYEQMGVVANFETEVSHQHIARQWFSDEGVLAWLPLSGKRISMVWSTSNDSARHLLGLEAKALAAEVSRAGKQALGNLTLMTPAVAFPLSLQTARNLIKPRLALIGDAAHQIHPLAGQGANLGFRDVISLVKVLSEKHAYQDIGDAALLRRYERERRTDMLVMKHMTHGLKMLFSSEQSALKKLRNWGLRLTDNQPALKKRLVRQAII